MSTTPPPTGWPPWLRDALDNPATDRKSWSSGLANAYIFLFLLIVYYDQLAGRRWPSAALAGRSRARRLRDCWPTVWAGRRFGQISASL